MDYFFYAVFFITLFFQILLLVSFLEEKPDEEFSPLEDDDFLTTSIIVPCFNEESTVEKTVDSLLELDFPKEKFAIVVVDDGSTDSTWSIVQKYKENRQVRLLQKENEGSKFAALNYALDRIDTDLVGVLDADSWVDSRALYEYMYFFRDQEVKAVIPTMVIGRPDSILRKAQRAEYEIGLFVRKAFAYLEAIYIAPGPFSMFRRSVFSELGYYKEAHHTEDAEIALRMQQHHYKIAYSEKSIVYTVGPNKVRALIKQRVRWVYGFIKNAIDYRHLFFKKEYRDLGMVILPIGLLSVFTTALMFPILIAFALYSFGQFIFRIYEGGIFFDFNFDWFFINVDALQVFGLIGFAVMLFTLYKGRQIIGKQKVFTWDVVYMFVVYSFVAPLWLIKSSWNALWSKKESWR